MARRGENIYKRKDGRWEGRYKCGFDKTGRTKYRSVYAKTYSEVKTKLLDLKKSQEHFQPSGHLTVENLFTEWLSAVRLKVKESTYANYCMKIEKHLLPAFGKVYYEKLHSRMIHSFMEQKLSTGLSAKYVSDIVVVFKSMAKYMSREYGYQNPLANVILPKKEKKEMRMLSDSEQKTMCSKAMREINSTNLGFLLSYYVGLRVGEICGLRWDDIDFEKRILTVNRTVQRITEKSNGKSTRLYIGSPKSKSSARSIPLPSFMVTLLQEYRKDDSFYLLSGTQAPVEPRTMQYRFASFLKRAELPSINYHALRHMFATNCVKLGFDAKTLSELLGHSSVETTLNRYVHSSMERKAACMELIVAA